ncbi:MAG: gliding motility protein GldL [Flavobacteriales bacterium]|nr:gliding motility protein GldL [Flavobacteriales bacterium]NNK80637.1 gliding motility protein GldL [Flavobacteriales bacterium]
MKPGSKAWKKFMAKLYGIGAAVVIIGALFKIQHWPFANEFLILGLGTEAVIFFFSAFEPIHEEVDWTLVYPELATGEQNEHSPAVKGGSMTEELDKMLEEAKIEPELIASLGDGMRALSSQAGKLSDITDASVATNDYVSKVSSASAKIGELSETYSRAAETIMGITSSSEDGPNPGEELSRMTSNLTSLNQMYELQLESARTKLTAADEAFSGIQTLMENLNASVSDTERYKENIAQLSNNLSALNTVYGNMLSAMNVNAVSH